MSLPVLYSFRRCPYAMRARLAILASGLSVELREIVAAREGAGISHQLSEGHSASISLALCGD